MIGERIGPYLLQRELGSGGMGAVYEATVVADIDACEPGERVAVKIVHPHLTARSGFLERFRREAELGRGVVHPNVVRTLDVGGGDAIRGGSPYVVLELVTGQTLAEMKTEMDRVSEDLCRHIATEIAAGLGALHAAGIVHRDLKPANVLITPEHVVKVMDLGLARQASGEDRLSRTGQFVGTAYYAPPEQFRGTHEVDPRGDLYSLGVLLYELATGRPPFTGDSLEGIMRSVLEDAPAAPCSVNEQLSPFFERLLLALLAKQPDDRPASAEELLEILEHGESGAWWTARSQDARAAQGRSRVQVPRETEIVGREAELDDLIARARSADGHAVLIEGEAGIGKTRLVDELLRRLESEAHVLYGACAPGGAATESSALVAALAAHLGAEGDDLERAVERRLAAAPGLARAFAALLRGDACPDGVEPLRAETLRTAVLHVLRALAAEKAVVLVVDDLVFAPREGRDLFATLALGVPGHPILLVGMSRPGLPSDWISAITQRQHVSRRQLGRISDADVTTIFERLVDSALDARRLADNVRARVGGNPYFLFEVVRALREQGVIARDENGSWRSAAHSHVVALPEGVRDLLRARLDRVPDDDRQLLECAACSGDRFDARHVAEALGVARIPALRALGRLEREHGLVRADGAQFAFAHHALREAIQEELPASLREEYHLALATATEARRSAAEGDVSEVDGALARELCSGFLRSSEPRRALRYLDAGLLHLEQACLFADAADLVERALEHADGVTGAERLTLLLRAYDIERNLGRPQRQSELLDQAFAAATALDDAESRARVNVAFGNHLYEQGLPDEAEERLQAAVDDAVARGDEALEMKAVPALGLVLQRFGRFDESRTCYRRWLELARAAGDRRAESKALGRLGNAWIAQGGVDEARHYYEQQLQISRDCAFLYGEAAAVGSLGRVAMSAGDHDAALECFNTQARIARQIGDRRFEIVGEGNASTLLIRTGRLDEAWRIVERLVELSREIGSRAFEATGIGNLGSIAAQQGRSAEAQVLHAQHRDLAREIGDVQGEMLAIGNLGVCAAAEGRHGDARRLYEERLALARRLDDRGNVAVALGHLATSADAMGDLDAAERYAREAIEAHRAIGVGHELANVINVLASIVSRCGRNDEAVTLLEEALVVARRVDSIDEIVSAQVNLAQLGAAEPRVVRETLRRDGARLSRVVLLRAHFQLWELESRRDDLGDAYGVLTEILAALPDAERTATLKGVDLFGQVHAAWHGDDEDSEAETVIAD